MHLDHLHHITETLPKTEPYPVLFIGHGNPMNALLDNTFTRALQGMAAGFDRPKAILCISAHWLTNGCYVAMTQQPKTIHDFGGFPRELFEQQYPAPGAPEYAAYTKELITQTNVLEDHDMGLDHGAWTVLKYLYPAADVPVYQLSIDWSKGPRWHYDLAQELVALRRRGVLILGSGNIVHNLRRIDWNEQAPVFDWAQEFDAFVKAKIDGGDHDPLINYEASSAAAKLSVPTNDHYLPMLYTLGLRERDDTVQHLFEGFQNASISMRCFRIG